MDSELTYNAMGPPLSESEEFAKTGDVTLGRCRELTLRRLSANIVSLRWLSRIGVSRIKVFELH